MYFLYKRKDTVPNKKNDTVFPGINFKTLRQQNVQMWSKTLIYN